MHRTFLTYLVFFTACLFWEGRSYSQASRANLQLDLDGPSRELKPVWNYFGYDEANYTTRPFGKKLLGELASLSPAPVYVRVHNLLTSGDGEPDLKWSSTNAYTEDANGKPVYDWKIVDSIFDTFVGLGMKPIAEIGFMPAALSIHPNPYRHHWNPAISYDSIYTGWTYPPASYDKWFNLVQAWVRHSVDRYGAREVLSWYWEVWNEPNIRYWQGSREEYFKLYDFTAAAVKSALPGARIGGPTSTGPRWKPAAEFLSAFLSHCVTGKNYFTGLIGAPLDYISFHAKGNPRWADGQVRMNMAVQLQDVQKAFEIIQAFPALKSLPVIIGEFDPEGCAACSVKYNPQNAYRNGTLYSSYTAASFAILQELAREYAINLTGAVSWSFEFENQPWFAGFRDLATNGVDKPVLNLFRIYGMMRGRELEVQSSRQPSPRFLLDSEVRADNPFIGAIASLDKNEIYVLAWNYSDEEKRTGGDSVSLDIRHIPAARLKISCYPIDETHANSYTQWLSMGSPQNPDPLQVRLLEKSGQLEMAGPVRDLAVRDGNLEYGFYLPARAITLIRLAW
jgi:xylan 1,4-beta-xylosidase